MGEVYRDALPLGVPQPCLAISDDGRLIVVEGAYANVPGLSYDVGPDGRLLLLRTDGGTERHDDLNVTLNWQATLEE